ncbi:MAG: hypothetical protein IPN76_11710 [Saprospiraceae bacterium]|nr:hypothetical protein [Saprospiraceae bacterium]
MKKQEGKIFGDNSGRSCFTIRIINKNEITGLEKPVPHKGYALPAFRPGSTFDVVLSIQSTPEFSLEHLVALFELTAILGGFGKRSRRAMGGVKILKKSLDSQDESNQNDIDTAYILNLINLFSSYYQKNENTIINTYQGTMQQYPWIKEIEFRKKTNKNIPVLTSNVTNQLHGRQGYPNNLAHANGQSRFASPIIVSVLHNEDTPIITTMNTVPFNGSFKADSSLQTEFKNNIL